MEYRSALTLLILIFSSCDPVAIMEADIENLTSQRITIDFVSSNEGLSKTLQIPPYEIVLFQEGFDVGGTFLQPSLVEYDSVLIKNQAEMILRVYKENDTGKNIFNTDEYWNANEPSKRFFKYEYEIMSEDIE
ncbi:MAG: hypothetical protein HKN53_04790 [Maribacter sp.]|nr:hypothetical protein [Maribacter sp.]